jgi:glutaredoxin
MPGQTSAYIVYGSESCPYCRKASASLAGGKIHPTEEIPESLAKISAGHGTIPKVFRATFVGGSDDLERELDETAGGQEGGGGDDPRLKGARALEAVRSLGRVMEHRRVLAVAQLPRTRGPQGAASGEVTVHDHRTGRATSVRYGRSSDDPGVMLLPAADPGGVARFAVPVESYRGGAALAVRGGALSAAAANRELAAEAGSYDTRDWREAYKAWLGLAGKRAFRGGARDGFKRWCESLPEGTVVRFTRPRPRLRACLPLERLAEAIGVEPPGDGGGAYATAPAHSRDGDFVEAPVPQVVFLNEYAPAEGAREAGGTLRGKNRAVSSKTPSRRGTGPRPGGLQ